MKLTRYNTNMLYLQFNSLSGIEEKSIIMNENDKIHASFVISLVKGKSFNFIDIDNEMHTIRNNFDATAIIYVIKNYLLLKLDQLQISDRGIRNA